MNSSSSDRRGAGILLGALLAADDAPPVLEHLAEGPRRRCQRELDALASEDRGARLAYTRDLAAQLMLPGPRRLTLIDASWLDHELSTLHPAVAAAVVEALPPPLAEELAAFAGCCGLPAAARLRLVQAALSRFERLDGPPLDDGAMERWLVGEQPALLAPLELLGAHDSAPEEVMGNALEPLEAEARPLALGAVMGAMVLEAWGAAERLLWRLPRGLGLWVDGARIGLELDHCWPATLAALLEEPS